MKIVYATYPWAFETPGGGEQQLLQYEIALSKMGLDINRHDPWAKNLADADLVHFFSCMGGSTHFCNYVRDQSLPLIISASLWLTNDTLHLYPTNDIRQQLQTASAIVTNGDLESERIQTLLDLPDARFVTVRNGFDAIFSKRENPKTFREHFGIQGEFLLNVGNIEPRKNQLALVRAAKAIDLPLVIIGHVRDRDYAETCFREGSSRIRYVGPLDHYSILLRSAYAACKVFCLPSTLETPGLAALEAAAAGTPLVITREGTTREYFADLAHYVDPHDEGDIVKQITSALNTPATGELAAHVAQHFTWDQAVSPLVTLYEDIVASRTVL